MLYLDIVRRPVRPRQVKKIDASKATAIPGVLAVITGQDLAKYNLHWMPTLMSDTQMVLPVEKGHVPGSGSGGGAGHHPLRGGRRRGRGGGRVRAPAVVVDPRKALEPGAPVLRTDKKDKRTSHLALGVGNRAETDRAFTEADVTIKEDIYIPRIHVPRSKPAGVSPTSTRSTAT